MTKEWRTVPDHPDYQVSNLGGVRSFKGCRDDGIPFEPRTLKSHADAAGYIRTQMDRKHRYVHWAVCTAWHGPCPPGMEVDHINGVRSDNRPENLRWVTRQANMARLAEKPLSPYCAAGHELSGDNLYIRPGGGCRECRTCARNRNKNRPPSGRKCTAVDCDREADCRLRTDEPLCEMHYQRDRTRAKKLARRATQSQESQ